MHVSRLISLLVMVVTISAGLFAVGQESAPPTRKSVTGLTMGPIEYHVTISRAPEALSQERLQSLVQTTLDRVNGLMSTYIDDSDVSRFNQSESTEFQSVDGETVTVVARALEISKQTEGAFDITVGPAVDLWNFGPNKADFQVPTPEQIAAVIKRVGYQKIQIRMDPPGIRKSEPGVRIDLSAIAKGYAVDAVAKTLESAGVEHYMVEVGGEVMTRGERPDGGKWRVGIQSPDRQPGAVGQVAEVSGRALATSGDYRNFVILDGVRYSHTIDPQTCRPVTHQLASACIIANDCTTADALATAVMVLGARRGVALCERLGVDYLFAARDLKMADQFSEYQSATFPLMGNPNSSRPSTQASRGSIWPTFLATAVVFALVILAMAVGSIFGNKPVQGSCGGLANRTNEAGETSCGICSKPVTDCVEKKNQSAV